MAAIVSTISRHGFVIELCHSKLALCKSWIQLNNYFKQLYISNKIEHFSYKGGSDVCGRTRIERFKEGLVWVKDKWLRVISSIMLFKNSNTTKKLKSNTVLSLNNINSICYYVVLSNIL